MESSNNDAWASLVHRSMEAWKETWTHEDMEMPEIILHILKKWTSLDEFLEEAPRTLMFWFFQQREAFLSQKTMQKWSRDRLDDCILLPTAQGFVLRTNCFFVSHFWQTNNDPDPDGKYLRLNQNELRSQPWSYIWVDWTCIPQHPRSEREEGYFLRSLQTMPSIIRNSGFSWHYLPFEARLWILYEIAEYTLTADGDWLITPDNKEFMDHIKEMLHFGVRPTLEKHGYRCSYERDKEFLTSWLEVLVLLRQLRIGIIHMRRLMGHLTGFYGNNITFSTPKGTIKLYRYEGTLMLNEVTYTFTPFPRWKDGKYSTVTKP
ncbi:hypothetical protein LX32DRAFT_639490 [Colletotrichum zoysiae]|uniref:Heterokaryon incompatibility domain-containing protein n=1 Tax=Colletotrichum zoysiae TaxID=1216348 RepID=A0AAD9M051_9PEZI|nr:hypothetical protein LX32DRAFT_639490 [Colletotrichum zoysiae]